MITMVHDTLQTILCLTSTSQVLCSSAILSRRPSNKPSNKPRTVFCNPLATYLCPNGLLSHRRWSAMSRKTYLMPKMAFEPQLVVHDVLQDLPFAQNGLQAISDGPRRLARPMFCPKWPLSHSWWSAMSRVTYLMPKMAF